MILCVNKTEQQEREGGTNLKRVTQGEGRDQPVTQDCGKRRKTGTRPQAGSQNVQPELERFGDPPPAISPVPSGAQNPRLPFCQSAAVPAGSARPPPLLGVLSSAD